MVKSLGTRPTQRQSTGVIMPQYLVAIHHLEDYEPSFEDEAMHRDIDVLNEEMIAAGVRVFVGGLHLAKKTRSRYGRNRVERCSSRTGRTWRRRSTSAAFGCWKSLT